MANDEAPQDPPVEAPGALSVDELAMQVVIELDRLAVTVAELRNWKPGEVLSLARGPEDPVRLVVETGMHRRVLAEGRVVVVDGKLAIEIGRVIAPLEPAKS